MNDNSTPGMPDAYLTLGKYRGQGGPDMAISPNSGCYIRLIKQ